ncbi:MAG: 50S ribosomal protein L3 [Rickettsiaceae bacterium]|nr:50S ribosomal protein L3 [Rickettsiaceae bacterium]
MTTLMFKKIGMTSTIASDTGAVTPVTLLQLEDCVVVGYKTLEKDGYTAVMIGYGDIKLKNVKKPMKGFYESKNLVCKKSIKEFRVDSLPSYQIGEKLPLSIFSSGEFVDVRGINIGKGFAGGMKRHNFGGLRASHGVSVSHRSIGSTGGRQDPGKTFKNKKMPGHMGSVFITCQNLRVVDVDYDKNLLILKGSVPGCAGSILTVSHALKKAI